MRYDYDEDLHDFQGDAERDARYETAFESVVEERGEDVERERERRAGRSDCARSWRNLAGRGAALSKGP
jgi:hypothetical protein